MVDGLAVRSQSASLAHLPIPANLPALPLYQSQPTCPAPLPIPANQPCPSTNPIRPACPPSSFLHRDQLATPINVRCQPTCHSKQMAKCGCPPNPYQLRFPAAHLLHSSTYFAFASRADCELVSQLHLLPIHLLSSMCQRCTSFHRCAYFAVALASHGPPTLDSTPTPYFHFRLTSPSFRQLFTA